MIKTKLSKICTIKTGKRDANHATKNGTYPFFTCADKPSLSPTYSFEGDSIILPGNGANVGLVLFYSGKFEAYQRTYVLINFQCNPKFLYYHLLAFWEKHNKFKQYGSATNYIKMQNFHDYTIPLPPLEEQKRIAEILDRADAIRQKRKRAIALTEELARSTFLDMFGDPFTNPKGWEIKSLENILNVIYRYPSFYGCKYVENGVPVIKISNINKEYRVDKNLNSYDKVSHSFSELFPKTIVKENDLVMAVRGDTTGKVGLIPYELQGANLSPNLIRLSPNYDICLPAYLFWVLRYGKPLIENRINDTAKKSLTATTLKDVSIPVPPKYLQQKFHQIFERMSYLKYKAEINQNNENNLFNSLLQRAFKGEF